MSHSLRIDGFSNSCNNEPVNKLRVDIENRIELPGTQPGDLFEVQEQGNGAYLLVRLDEEVPVRPRTPEEVLQAMERYPLRLSKSWEQLREITREP